MRGKWSLSRVVGSRFDSANISLPEFAPYLLSSYSMLVAPAPSPSAAEEKDRGSEREEKEEIATDPESSTC